MRYLFLILWLAFSSCGGVEAETELLPPAGEAEDRLTKQAVTNAGGDVGVEAGFIADGASITLPTGFTADECVFTASLASVSGEAISSRVAVNRTTGEVTCKSVVQEGELAEPEEKSCSASYIVVCAK